MSSPSITPINFLKGCYAYSHSALWWAHPPFPNPIPQLGAFYESPASPGNFSQVQGFSVVSFAGYLCFDGAGKLQGSGIGIRGGKTPAPAPMPLTGTYTVDVDIVLGSHVYSGIITTESGGTFINHYYVMADNWKELKFIMLDTHDNLNKPLRQPITSGVMTRIH